MGGGDDLGACFPGPRVESPVLVKVPPLIDSSDHSSPSADDLFRVRRPLPTVRPLLKTNYALHAAFHGNAVAGMDHQ